MYFNVKRKKKLTHTFRKCEDLSTYIEIAASNEINVTQAVTQAV